MRYLLPLLFLAAPAFAQDNVTAHTYRLAGGQKPPEATVGIMRWMAGTWSGEGLGGFSQETWSEPMQGGMIGMFRQLKDGKPEFYEFMTLSEEGGTVVLRIKHFTPPNLVGWEDKDKAETFRYVGKKNGAILFEGLTYQPDGDRGAIIYVATKKGEELEFKLTRSR